MKDTVGNLEHQIIIYRKHTRGKREETTSHIYSIIEYTNSTLWYVHYGYNISHGDMLSTMQLNKAIMLVLFL